MLRRCITIQLATQTLDLSEDEQVLRTYLVSTAKNGAVSRPTATAPHEVTISSAPRLAQGDHWVPCSWSAVPPG